MYKNNKPTSQHKRRTDKKTINNIYYTNITKITNR